MSVPYAYDAFGSLDEIFVATPTNYPADEYSFQSSFVNQLDSWYALGDAPSDQLLSPGTSPAGSPRTYWYLDESSEPFSTIESYPLQPALSYHRNAAGTCSSPPQKRPPYYCQRCHRTFSTTTNFTRHDTSSMCATNARGDPISHPCTQCNKTYNRKDNLKKHIKDKHPVAEARQNGAAPR